MSELRRDPLTGRWVIIAPERADRPNAFLRRAPMDEPMSSPFLPGKEQLTPPEVFALREPGSSWNGPGWNVRVVPNRFPALRTETAIARKGIGLFDQVSGTGAHEVIVESPDPRGHLGTLPQEQVQRVLSAWAERIRDLSRDTRLRYAQLFQNHGQAAGATVSHPHAQLIALPLVPPDIVEELAVAKAHFDEKERCLTCDVLAQEREDRSRIVLETATVIALAPYASRSPFEVQLFPKAHRSAFERTSDAELAGLADALRLVLGKLDVALEKPAYNLFLVTQPLREPDAPHAHFRLGVRPALALWGGFEWGAGLTINPTPPEEAARFLRQTEVPS